jgi:hypothetical protein
MCVCRANTWSYLLPGPPAQICPENWRFFTDSLTGMSDVAVLNEPPRGHARIVYLGPVSPHWEVYSDYGDANLLEEFRARVLARLVLLPRNDPQFRRNQERVNRDAERERISVEWEIGWADESA